MYTISFCVEVASNAKYIIWRLIFNMLNHLGRRGLANQYDLSVQIKGYSEFIILQYKVAKMFSARYNI